MTIPDAHNASLIVMNALLIINVKFVKMVILKIITILVKFVMWNAQNVTLYKFVQSVNLTIPYQTVILVLKIIIIIRDSKIALKN